MPEIGGALSCQRMLTFLYNVLTGRMPAGHTPASLYIKRTTHIGMSVTVPICHESSRLSATVGSGVLRVAGSHPASSGSRR